jgi:hypothetical protein
MTSKLRAIPLKERHWNPQKAHTKLQIALYLYQR